MAEREVLLRLPGRTVAALRQLGVVTTATRTCAASNCDQLFVPTDQRQSFCSESCGNRHRQAMYRDRSREKAAVADIVSRGLPDDMAIVDAPLKTGTIICIRKHLATVGDVRAKTDSELLKIPNLGRKRLFELRSL